MSIPAQQPEIPRIGVELPIAYQQPNGPIIVVPAAPPRGMSIASFVLGLVSIVGGFVFVLPLLSVILGIAGLRKEPAGRGFAIAGLVVGGLILAVWVVIGLFMLTLVLGTAATGIGAATTGLG